MLTERLPLARVVLSWLVIVAATLNTLFSAWLIGFQLLKTDGYQRPVPAILTTSFLSMLFPIWFMYSKPFNTSRPLTTKLTLFLRSIAFELLVFAALGAMMLVCVADLHADTPGLLSSCGGFLTCRLLTAVLALSWLTILFLGLAFSLLLLSFLYFTIKRRRAIPALTTPFNEVNWAEYAARRRQPAIPLRASPREEEFKEPTAARGQLDQVFVVVDEDVEKPRVSGLHERKKSRDVDVVVQL